MSLSLPLTFKPSSSLNLFLSFCDPQSHCTEICPLKRSFVFSSNIISSCIDSWRFSIRIFLLRKIRKWSIFSLKVMFYCSFPWIFFKGFFTSTYSDCSNFLVNTGRDIVLLCICNKVIGRRLRRFSEWNCWFIQSRIFERLRLRWWIKVAEIEFKAWLHRLI